MDVKLKVDNLKPFEISGAFIMYAVVMTLLSWGGALIEKNINKCVDEITHAIGFDSGSEAYEEDEEDDEDDAEEGDCEDSLRNYRRIGF